MTQNVSSRSGASASCSVLRTEQSHILRRITGGQPRITRLLGIMSEVCLRIQTEMPDRCTEGTPQKGIRPPPVEPKILGVFKRFPRQRKSDSIGLLWSARRSEKYK